MTDALDLQYDDDDDDEFDNNVRSPDAAVMCLLRETLAVFL